MLQSFPHVGKVAESDEGKLAASRKWVTPANALLIVGGRDRDAPHGGSHINNQPRFFF